MLNFVDFISKSCKIDKHAACHGLWRGLNIEARCYCECHKKKEQALEVAHSSANALHVVGVQSPSSQEVNRRR